ncbi:MAG: L,D-transpeptidase family protein [Gammaproteobacteria bacterium]|nr:L,D-transpeptidase family protein [Gammaproteobacteria bacterium]
MNNVYHDRQTPIPTVIRYVIAFSLITLAWLGEGSLVLAEDYELEVIKSKQLLLVKKGTEIERSYHVAYGMGGLGTKHRSGDSKTPEGVYRVLDFGKDSKFYYFMQLNYPNLLDAWYGYKNKVISGDEFEAILSAIRNTSLPPQDTGLGGYIGIHGIGQVNSEKLHIHNEFNWTDGCIALTNNEINDLRQYVSIGTRVLIRE